MKKLSIIVPHYNRWSLLAGCLDSLSKQNYQDFEVLVVDNGSTDNSRERIKNRSYPFSIFWIELKTNLGFARAVNEGIRASSSPYVMILNNDVRLDSDCIGRMIFVLEKLPKIGVVTCRIMSANNPYIVDSCGAGISKECKCFQIGWGRRWDSTTGFCHHLKNILRYGQLLPVFGSTGTCAIFRRNAFEKVGLFDEEFFMYLEDMDWAIRACALGIRTVVVFDALAFHIGGGTAGGYYSEFSLFWIVRNQLFLIVKNISFEAIVKWFPYILFGQIKTAGKAIIILGKPGIYLKAVVNFLKVLPMALKKRRKIIKLSCGELERHVKRSLLLKDMFLFSK